MPLLQKSKLRISSTTLDLFNTYLQPGSYITSKDKLITMLTTYTPSTKMTVGSDLGNIIETGIDNGRFEDSAEVIKTCLDIHETLKDGVFEAKTVSHYPEYNIDVVCKADCILGSQVYEFKTTSEYKYDKYLNSVQWKFYLECYQADSIEYIVLPIKITEGFSEVDNGKSWEHNTQNSVELIGEPYIFKFTKSDYNKKDLNLLIENFLTFINENKLELYYYPKN